MLLNPTEIILLTTSAADLFFFMPVMLGLNLTLDPSFSASKWMPRVSNFHLSFIEITAYITCGSPPAADILRLFRHHVRSAHHHYLITHDS